MIIVDLSQVMISNLFKELGTHIETAELNESMLRHFILNSIRSYRSKFVTKYGELVIACDDSNNWRKDVYPYYKANRAKSREESKIDWNAVFTILHKIRDEIKEFFPYRVLHIPRAEADDIIGSLVMKHGNTNEKILIMSGDKDFKQLQTYLNVEQYDPIQKKFLVENDPEKFLKRHIMKGDSGDGVPNYLSADNCLVLGIRQKPVREKKIEEYINKEPEEFCNDDQLRYYYRNKKMIDLTEIPSDIQDLVHIEYDKEAGKKRDKLFGYFIQHRLKNLMSDISDF